MECIVMEQLTNSMHYIIKMFDLFSHLNYLNSLLGGDKKITERSCLEQVCSRRCVSILLIFTLLKHIIYYFELLV